MNKFEKYMQDPETMGGKFSKYMTNMLGERARNSQEADERTKSQRRQKQYEAQDKQEGSGMMSGGKVSSASSRGDGIATKCKTRVKMC
jgi:hypothetical protein